MALPRQVALSVTYDGTVTTTEEVTTTTTTTTEAETTSYTVKSGDTLWAISKKYLGAGSKYMTIYNANKSVIEATAKKHGKSSSSNGHWIYPGTVLSIPVSSSTTKTTTSTKTVTKKSGTSDPALGTKIAEQATAFSYNDVASGSSDDISLTMYDIDKEWIGTKKPKKGADFGVKLKLTNWNDSEKKETFNCGTFVLDDISFSGRPLKCVLGAVSVPANDDFKSLERSETWESATIKSIAQKIAKRAGVSLYYDADSITISEDEQSEQTDSAYLYALCEKYGLGMKVYNKKIVIFDIVKYEKKSAVATIKESQMLSWSYDETVEGTYTGVELSYTDPEAGDDDDDATITVTLGKSGRMYKMTAQATSEHDAKLQAAAKYNAANREIETMSVKIKANINLVASQCVKISGLGDINGKYYIDKIAHSVGSGYTMSLTLHKVQTPIVITTPVSSSSSGTSYTIKYGDTLWALAKKYYGSGAKYTIIYNANKDVLDAAAKKHGRSNCNGGNWIWPGTTITIPDA